MYDNTYIVSSTDIEIAGEFVPATSEGNSVTQLIDGEEYFASVLQEIDKLIADSILSSSSNGFFYVHSWWLQSENISGSSTIDANDPNSVWNIASPVDGSNRPEEFFLDQAKTISLKNKIVELASHGIDVRIFGWINPLMLSSEQTARAMSVNLATIRSVQALRQIPGLQNKICLNTLGHNRGAMHLKFLICGNSTHSAAFISGLDFAPLRFDERRVHTEGWHDAGVKINGPANQAVFNFFRDIWNEQVNRPPFVLRLDGVYVPSHVINRDTRSGETSFDVARSSIANQITPLVTNRTLIFSNTGTHKIQLLRTIPKIGAGLSANSAVLQNPLNSFSPFSFAPQGIYEFRVALKKAISQAKKYIYIEDQGFFSWEAFQWVNQQIKSQPNLKVILFNGGDPADPPNSLMSNAINGCLLKDLSPAQIARIFLWQRPIAIHAKVVIIDDKWASVGSANFFQRSLYTDGELSVSVISDVTDANIKYSFAGTLRLNLTLEHCADPTPMFNEFDLAHPLYDIDEWLKVWDATNPSFTLHADIARVALPLSSAPALKISENLIYDTDPYHEEYSDFLELIQRITGGGSPNSVNFIPSAQQRCQ